MNLKDKRTNRQKVDYYHFRETDVAEAVKELKEKISHYYKNKIIKHQLIYIIDEIFGDFEVKE